MREVWSLTTWHAQHVPSTAAETVVASPSGSCHRLRRVPKPAVPVARLGTVGWRKMICHARRQGESGGWPDDLALTAPASPQERAGGPLLGRRMALRSARGRKRPSAPTSWPAVSGTPRKSGCVPPEPAGSYAERGDRVGVWRGGDAGRFASSAAVGLAEGPAQGRPLRYSAMIPWLLRPPLRLRPPDGDLRRPLPETA